MKKHTRIGDACRAVNVIYYDEDESAFIEIKNYEQHAFFGFSADESRRVARALSPLYVVKSAAGCYATFGACQPFDNSDEYAPEDYNHRSVWTDDRSQAAHFVTKEAARAVADNAAYASAGPRVVRVKR